MKSLLTFLLLTAAAFGQVGNAITDTVTLSVSASTATFTGGRYVSNRFEYVISGGPGSMSIVLQGCMRGGTCTTLNTSSATTSNTVSWADTYDSYTVTPTWTGGASVQVIINRLGTTARNFIGGANQLLAADGSISAPSYSFASQPTIGWYRAGNADVRYASGGIDQARFAPAFIVAASSGVNFASTGVQSVNAALVYDGATGVLGQRSGATAQGHRVYNTFTDASNNEYGTFDWTTTASTLTIGSVANGTGTGRSVVLQAAGASSISFKVNNAIKFFINSSGNFVAGSDNANDIGAAGASRPRTLFVGTSVNSPTYLTTTNCSSAAGTCVAAPAGSVTIAAAATTVTVATTAVTASSQIILTEDSSLGTKLSVTCNTTLGRHYAVTARTAATSFVITTDAAPVTNPACLSYMIVN